MRTNNLNNIIVKSKIKQLQILSILYQIVALNFIVLVSQNKSRNLLESAKYSYIDCVKNLSNKLFILIRFSE